MNVSGLLGTVWRCSGRAVGKWRVVGWAGHLTEQLIVLAAGNSSGLNRSWSTSWGSRGYLSTTSGQLLTESSMWGHLLFHNSTLHARGTVSMMISTNLKIWVPKHSGQNISHLQWYDSVFVLLSGLWALWKKVHALLSSYCLTQTWSRTVTQQVPADYTNEWLRE